MTALKEFAATVAAAGVVERPATTADDEPRIMLCAWKNANAFPKPANKVPIFLAPLSEALRTKHRTDAHFGAYTTTECRRLGNEAVGLVPIAMVFLVADVDDPVAHRLSTPARPDWREAERAKIDRLRAQHPGCIVYETGGGYRVLFRCEPFAIATREDARAWWGVYGRFVRYLREAFGIVADPACKDFSRLYRLPRVKRDGVQTDGVILGDSEHIEALDMDQLPEAPREAHPFVRAALRKAVEAVRTATNGARNETLNREAFALAGFIPGGHLDETELADALLKAIVENDGDENKDAAKIASAIEAGKAQPREPPERTSRGGGEASSSSGARSRARAPAAGAAAPERQEVQGHGRPTITITTELFENVSAASAALRNDPHLFKRGSPTRLVHVARITPSQVDRSRVGLVEGAPTIADVEFATLRERLTVVASFERWKEDKAECVPALPTPEITAALLARGDWPTVRRLDTIVEAPTMRPDGSIVQEPGYDAATRVLYVPNAAYPLVPQEPTHEDARRAYASLVDLFCDFPHEDDERDKSGNLVRAGAHKAVPIACAMTIVARPAIVGSVPMFAFDANTRGSGKSMQTDAVAIIASGRHAPRMTYPTDDAELEKVLAGYALQGTPFFSLDNITRPLGGAPIDRILTATDTIQLRVLGENRVPTLPWRAVPMGTGNNLTFSPDTARRVTKSRLTSAEVNPEKRRDFRHDDLLAFTSANRAALLTALLTVLRAYVVAGRPEMQCERWGSFEAWSRFIPHAIVWAGGADPMLARPASDAEANPETAAVLALMTTMRRLEAKRTTAGLIEAFDGDPLSKMFVPDDTSRAQLREAVEQLCGRRPTPRALAAKLQHYRERVFELEDGSNAFLKATTGKGGFLRWEVQTVKGGA